MQPAIRRSCRSPSCARRGLVTGAAFPGLAAGYTQPGPVNGIEIDVTCRLRQYPARMCRITLTRAMLMHVALMYELRGAIPSDMQPAAIPPL